MTQNFLLNANHKKMQNISIDYETFNDSGFYDIANILLNKSVLSVSDSLYRIVEVEFYYKSDIHNDEYVHCDPDQLLKNTFYFHKFKTGTYKAGTFKGLDITLGDKDEDVYFGILIRAIQNLDTLEIIEGPCKSVNKILEEYEVDKIIDFTNKEIFDIFENRQNFVLLNEEDRLEIQKIASGPRIGLSDKYPEFKNRPYRFAIYKEKIKKQKRSLLYV